MQKLPKLSRGIECKSYCNKVQKSAAAYKRPSETLKVSDDLFQNHQNLRLNSISIPCTYLFLFSQLMCL
nr:MAG TPA: hypothetical protein [Caudoviricetes sp.]